MNKHKWTNRIFFFLFTMMFFTEIFVISRKANLILQAPVILWVMLGFATLRLAHTVSFNGVAEWLRFPFTKEVEDTSGAGGSLEAKDGLFNVVGQLISCPICSGTWSAMFLVSIYAYFPALGTAFIAVLGVAGISEMLHWGSQLLEWGGRASREASGSMWLQKNRGKVTGYYLEDGNV